MKAISAFRALSARLGATLAFVLLAGCGSSDSGAPEGSLITIAPASITFADATGVSNVNAQPIFVTVRNKDGVPVPNVTILISVPTTFASVVRFNDTVGTPIPGTQFVAQTDNNGVYTFVFEYDSGGTPAISYFGDLSVNSNSAVATMRFTIS